MTFLLVIIYLAFVSLGLPDSLLGSAWPVMHVDLGAPISAAGTAAMIVSLGTVVSSLASARVIGRFGPGPVTAVSVGMTAVSLVGMSFVGSLWQVYAISVPLGLGAGSVDAALNNFVALHYRASHMNWLHCFWGVGATLSPYIMAVWLARDSDWPMGYRTVGILQGILVIVLVISLPAWRGAAPKPGGRAPSGTERPGLRDALSLPGAKPNLLGFLSYSALEVTIGLWFGSFAVGMYEVPTETSAGWTSFFFLGITLGRLICGFLAARLDSPELIRLGLWVMGTGLAVMLVPLPLWRLPVSLWLLGLGCAPIYPSTIHMTPRIFGAERSQSMIGFQMAFAYVGSTVMPLWMGQMVELFSLVVFPVFVILFFVILAVCSALTSRRLKKG